MNLDGLYVAERPDGCDLMSLYGWPSVASAASRAEMDLKLAAMGLEADWSCGIGIFAKDAYHPVRRIPE